jgi:hypothetical protein
VEKQGNNIQSAGIVPEADSKSVDIILTGVSAEEDFEGMAFEEFPDCEEGGYMCPCGGRL